MAQRLLTDAEYQKMLRGKLRAGELPPAVWTTLYYYGFGKPAEKIEMNVPEPVTVISKFFGVSSSNADGV